MQKQTRNTLILQLLIAIGVALFWLYKTDLITAVAGLYGGLMVVVNSLWQWHSMRRAEALPEEDVQANMGHLYRFAIQRFVMTVALFALGIFVLTLDPKALLSGFIAGQLSLLFGSNNKRV